MWPKAIRKWFRISCGHGQQSKDDDHHEPTLLYRSHGLGQQCKTNLDWDVVVLYSENMNVYI